MWSWESGSRPWHKKCNFCTMEESRWIFLALENNLGVWCDLEIDPVILTFQGTMKKFNPHDSPNPLSIHKGWHNPSTTGLRCTHSIRQWLPPVGYHNFLQQCHTVTFYNSGWWQQHAKYHWGARPSVLQDNACSVKANCIVSKKGAFLKE